MAATEKAVQIARQLAEDLGLRTGLAVVKGVDASGNPTISLGTLTAGSQGAFIRVTQESSIQVDGIGNPQRVYTPHIIQLVLELSTTTKVAIVKEDLLAQVIYDTTKFGTKVELYNSANTVAPSVAGITGSPVVTINDLWHPLTSTI